MTAGLQRRSRTSRLSRRDCLRLASLGCLGSPFAGWFEALAGQAGRHPDRHRACILLWMPGGPSQIDTFDPKPGHENGGEFKAIDTTVPGMQLCEHLPKLSRMAEHLAVVRSMRTQEGDHARATFVMRTGYAERGPVQYPCMGSVLSKELGTEESELPNYVSVAPYRFFSPSAFGPGFLGPRHAPLIVGDSLVRAAGQGYAKMGVKNMTSAAGVTESDVQTRLRLLAELEEGFVNGRRGRIVNSHQSAYEKAVRMMRSSATAAFELDEESRALRDQYGRSQFGQGCLLARRLVERGVPFVEVSLSGVSGAPGLTWDTHQNNFTTTRRLCEVMDQGWATLMRDLKDRGMLESTLIVWMGEFGRTPRINGNGGRDHFPAAWSTVLGGGGIRGGQVVGRTSEDGMTIEDRPVQVGDLLATVCRALGVDPRAQNMSNVGRPIRLADPEANPIEEIIV